MTAASASAGVAGAAGADEVIFCCEHFEVLAHEASLPWVKIFALPAQLELGDDERQAARLFAAAMAAERALRAVYAPRKVNHASFANECPRAHWHVMARFERDAWWPRNVWQQPLREEADCRGDWASFCERLRAELAALGADVLGE